MQALIPPRELGQTPVRAPMVYVEKRLTWEYKHIVRNLENELPLDEAELNQLGRDGWEMTGIVQQASMVHHYFKREVER